MKHKREIKDTEKPTCIGTGLVALDVIISGDTTKPAQFLAGGSCGNVMAILSYLGWSTYPVARLSNNVAGELLVEDMVKWQVHDDLITLTPDGSTPVIIHRILKDNQGRPKHRFEFRNPEDGSYLPSYKPCLAKSVHSIIEASPAPKVFYFDRINRASLDLARAYRAAGAVIFFEPSNMKDEQAFSKALAVSDVIKFSNERMPDYDNQYPAGATALEIQTLGSDGLKFRRNGNKKWTKIDSFSISGLTDSAGAGDWCTAGIIKYLFTSDKPLKSITQNELIDGLTFGQVLGALNCTYEGARGMMYAVKSRDLLLAAAHIVESGTTEINQTRKFQSSTLETPKELKISSLFVSY